MLPLHKTRPTTFTTFISLNEILVVFNRYVNTLLFNINVTLKSENQQNYTYRAFPSSSYLRERTRRKKSRMNILDLQVRFQRRLKQRERNGTYTLGRFLTRDHRADAITNIGNI